MNPLTTGDFTEAEEPFALFKAWMAEAEASEPNDPNAMALATVDATGLPNVRMVLLKGADENGFVFYTNTESNKGRELLGQSEGRDRAPLEEPAPPGARPRAGHPGERGRGRRLFPEPPPRQPHRRLGEPAIAPAREPLRPGEGGGAQHGEIRHRRGAAPALLDGLPHRAGLHRVLAGQAVPPPRPRGLHAARARAGARCGFIPEMQRYAMDPATQPV